MQAERWKQIDQIFGLVLEQPAGERRQLLDSLCAGDPELLTEVLELLDADSASDHFLDEPPLEVAGLDLSELADCASREAEELCRKEEALDRLPSGFPENERYQLIRRIGTGGMGIVYEAEDLERGERVALKMLKTVFLPGTQRGRAEQCVDPEMLYRIKHEFRSLAELHHPNLVTLHEMVVSEDCCFFTMELIKGADVLSHVRRVATVSETSPSLSGPMTPSTPGRGYTPSGHPGRPPSGSTAPVPDSPLQPIVWPTCDEERLRAILPQLTRGLSLLHDAGKVHRDVKPSNILVTPEGRVVLLDFGLVTHLESNEQSKSSRLMGTATYMAPEQCLTEHLTPAADWYAVGVLLYEALTGRPPFSGSFGKVVLEKQQYQPAPPRSIVIDVPRDLDELCVALLARDPRERPSGAEIIRRLGADKGARALPSAVPGNRRTMPFAGRHQEMQRLAHSFASVLEGHTHAVLVCGASGIGKSTLIRRFLDRQRAIHNNLVVLEGRCYDRETVPYQAIDYLIDNLSRYWRRLPAVRAAELVPREAALLPRLFPVLGRVPAVVDSPLVREISDPQELRTRSFAALRETLQRLGERNPLVLFLDDMQWADASTQHLLADLMRPPDPPLLLLLLASRPESKKPLGELIHSMDAVTEVQSLDALPQEAAVLLARQLLGPEMEQLAEQVAEEAAGNPFFIIELAQHLRSAPTELDDTADADASFQAVSLDDVLLRRIRDLPDAARRVLEVVSLAGAHLSQRTLRYSTGLTKMSLAHQLTLLRSLSLVRTTGWRSHESVEPFHDRIRNATLSSIPDRTKRSHHRALALALEGKASAEQLAFHWRGAGQLSRAAEHAKVAAGEALARLDFDRAANLFRMALRFGDHDRHRLRDTTVALAEALANAGRPAEAAAAFNQASQVTSEPTERLDLRRRSAEELLRGGYLEKGLQAIREVLAEIGFRLSETPRRALLSLILQRFRIRLHRLRWRARLPSDIPPWVLARIDGCWSVLVGLSCVEPIRGAEYHARHLLMALRSGEQRRIARALATEVCYLALRSSRRSHRVHTLSRELATTLDNPYLRALSCIAAGFYHYSVENRWQATKERCVEAVELLRTQGGWELDNARLWRCYSQIYLGELGELARQVPSYARAADRRGDRYMAVTVRTRANIIWLVRNQIERAREELELALASWMPAGEVFQVQHLFALWAACEIDLYQGDPQRAATRMSESSEQVRGSLILHMPMASLEHTFLKARIALANAAVTDQPELPIREANRLIRRLQGIRLPLSRALVPLLQAGVARLRADTDATERLLRQAVAELESLDTWLYANAVKRRLGALVGGDEGAALLTSSEAWMRGQGIRDPARITALLVPGWPDKV